MSAPTPDLPLAGRPASARPAFDLVDAAMADLAERAAAIMIPVESLAYGISPRSKYCALVHAQLCRAKFLGLSDRSCARLVGIQYETLLRWFERFPKLRADMNQAVELGKTRAAVKLIELMKGDGPTAFQATKFFLERTAPEFAERARLNVNVDARDVMRSIRTGLYGLPDVGDRTDEPDGSPDGRKVVDAVVREVGVEEGLASEPGPPALPAPESGSEPASSDLRTAVCGMFDDL